MNDHERYLFDLQGYLVVEHALTADQVAAINAIIDEHIAADMPGDKQTHRFTDLLLWGQPMVDLIDNPSVAAHVEAINGDLFRLDHVYCDVIRSGLSPIGANLHGGNVPYHSPNTYHVSEGQIHCGLTVVAYNLHDVLPGDGGFACVPGSHKANWELPSEWRDLTQARDIVKKVTGPAGSAVIFTEALTHGPLPWTGAAERRTVFFKYNNRAMAWAPTPPKMNEPEKLTERQRQILMPPCSENHFRRTLYK